MLKCLPADLPLYCRSGNRGAYNKVQTNQLLSAVLVQWIFKHLIIKTNLYAGQFSEQDGNSLGADARALTHEEGLLKQHRENIYLGPPIRWTLQDHLFVGWMYRSGQLISSRTPLLIEWQHTGRGGLTSIEVVILSQSNLSAGFVPSPIGKFSRNSTP